MSQTVVIALAGADVSDLHTAQFAEIRRQPYLDDARLLTNHNIFHGDMSVNEERAAAAFAEAGRTSDAVLQQAVPLEVSEELKCKLCGPADTGGAGVAHEQVAAVDGEAVEPAEDDEEPPQNVGLPDEEFPEATLPPMHFCADGAHGFNISQSSRAINFRFARAQQIQIGPVDYVERFAHSACRLLKGHLHIRLG